MLLGGVFSEIVDYRKAKGKRYELEPLLCGLLLAVLSGATSFRKMECFLNTRLTELNALFGTCWKAAPTWVGIRKFLLSIAVDELEAAVRRQGQAGGTGAWAAAGATVPAQGAGPTFVAIDGKALRGSADRVQDRRARQLVSAFCQHDWIVLGHLEVAGKASEMAAVQQLIGELDLAGRILTLDALHCQKKP